MAKLKYACAKIISLKNHVFKEYSLNYKDVYNITVRGDRSNKTNKNPTHNKIQD